MKNAIKRLWLPTTLLLFFALLAAVLKILSPYVRLDIINRFLEIGWYVAQIGLWLAIAFFVNRMLYVFVWEGMAEKALGVPVPRLLKGFGTIIVYLLAITVIVGFVFKVPVTGIWATSGAISIVLGIALRSVILDTFIGLAINIERPYQIGDWIMIHGRKPHPEDNVIGCIVDINWRTTQIKPTDNTLVVVPNSVMGSKIVTNFMKPDEKSRFELYFCLDFSIPTNRAIRVMTAGAKAAINANKGLLENPRPSIRVNMVTPAGVEYRLKYWLIPREVSPSNARHLMTSSILAHLRQAGLTLAYPKQDIFHKEMPARYLDSSSVDVRMKLLAKTSFFSTLDPENLKLMATNMRQRFFREGETIIKQGHKDSSMFVSFEGLLDVYVDFNQDGADEKVGQILPGDFFGEMSLLTGEARFSTVIAATEAIVYEITHRDMIRFLVKQPEYGKILSKMAAERHVKNVEASASMTEAEKEERTAALGRHILNQMKSFFKNL